MQVCDNQFQPGFTHPGSFAERVAVAHAAVNLVALPDEVDLISAAALGCRFSTAYRAVRGQGRPRAGDWVAVHGCGGVGLSAVQVAVAGGARVVAVDMSADALALAAGFGAEVLVDPAEVADVVEAVRAATDGGAHVSLDALGSPATCVTSVLSLRKRGRHVQVGLLPPADGRPELPMEQVIGRELEILGSHGMAAHAYPELLADIASGALRPDLLVTRRIALEAAGEALATMVSAPVAGVTVVTRLRAGETDPHDRHPG
jgi:alcohol dehydrogenase